MTEIPGDQPTAEPTVEADEGEPQPVPYSGDEAQDEDIEVEDPPGFTDPDAGDQP